AARGGVAGDGDPSDPGGGAGSTSVHDPSGLVVPTTLPRFPGGGTSNAGDPLPNGILCDAVAGADTPIPERIERCFFDKNDPSTGVAATLEQVLECVEESDTVHLRLTFHPWFVDNTYGANAIGWAPVAAVAPMDPMMMPMGGKMPKMPKMGKGGHTFKDLVGSDHAEIILEDAAGAIVMRFKLDYLSEDAQSPSGYGALGVLGGEGKVLIGNPAHVVRWMTSEDRNLNERGYASYTVDSPATDENYTPNTDTPEWDYRVVYEAWIDLEAFGAAGFGDATIEYVHASPAKSSSNTIEVEPGKCPPCQDPDGCHDNPPPPPPGKVCGADDPDEVCGDAGIPNGGTPVDCIKTPDDEGCMVE
ncbi:MAG TPA: hypothetical protein VK509_07755, partial [Polyangiales bacterium]|nr:hypothetical protein [Polyangiales bacterium]